MIAMYASSARRRIGAVSGDVRNICITARWNSGASSIIRIPASNVAAPRAKNPASGGGSAAAIRIADASSSATRIASLLPNRL